MKTWACVGLVLLSCACGRDDAVLGGESAAPEAAVAPPALGVAAPGLAGRTLVARRDDLPEMLARRTVRVLVPYEPPYFFFDRAGPRGILFEAFREYGRFLEQQRGLRRGSINVVYVPCELGTAIAWLNEGYGDVVGSALTVTPERAREVAFTKPLVQGVREIIVTSRSATELAGLDDLAGREVWVTAGSSYVEHVRALSEDLAARGLAPIAVREAPRELSTEDLFEMVHAGILELTVGDDYRAELWAEVLPDLVLREDLVVHRGGELAWAVRSDNPELRANLDEFVGHARKGTLLGNVLIERYLGSTKWIENPGASTAEQLERYAGLIRELADEYDFDWLRIGAQCFQESRLDPRAKSPAGAIGLMQLRPATARDMGCEDPYDPEQNLRAGVRYLDWLRESYFADPGIEELERTDLILAAYNAGPGRVREWRRQAEERGLDPNRWRDHVERLCLEDVGLEPIRYVDNIEKYYVAYSLAYDLARDRERYKDQDG